MPLNFKALDNDRITTVNFKILKNKLPIKHRQYSLYKTFAFFKIWHGHQLLQLNSYIYLITKKEFLWDNNYCIKYFKFATC
jgi:hypothetical protein